MRVAAAFDHRGVKLREAVLESIDGRTAHVVVDLGAETDAVRIDYPDKALELGMAIRRGEVERGVLVCGSGVGASVAASKIPGIRAAICHDTYSAHQGVEHDDMNVLCLGSEIVGGRARARARPLIPRRPLRRRGPLRRPPREGGRARKDVRWLKSRLHQLSDAGVSVWIDSLSREMLDSGLLAALMADDAVVGVTSNPTIFQKALAEGDLLRRPAARGRCDDGRPGRDLLRARDGRHP